MNINPVNNNKTSFGALLFADAKVPSSSSNKKDDVQILMLEPNDNFSRAQGTYFITTKDYKGVFSLDKKDINNKEQLALQTKLSGICDEIEAAGAKAGDLLSTLVVEIANGRIVKIFNARKEAEQTRDEVVRVKRFEASV